MMGKRWLLNFAAARPKNPLLALWASSVVVVQLLSSCPAVGDCFDRRRSWESQSRDGQMLLCRPNEIKSLERDYKRKILENYWGFQRKYSQFPTKKILNAFTTSLEAKSRLRLNSWILLSKCVSTCVSHMCSL